MPLLETLRLSGVPLTLEDLAVLRDAGLPPRLATLDWSWTELGRHSQRGCAVFAELLPPRLTDLDVSGNFFAHAGFRSLGHALAQRPVQAQLLSLISSFTSLQFTSDDQSRCGFYRLK